MSSAAKSILFTALITALALAVFPAAAQIKPIAGKDCGELGIKCDAGDNKESLVTFITTIINAFLALTAIIAVIFVIWGGVKYMTAQGDETQVGNAKKTILYAVVGLIIITLSAAIVQFVTEGIG